MIYIAAPANFIEGFPAVMSLFYGSIVTPAFEELLFLGLIWKKCEETGWGKTSVYVLNIVLFMIWHAGYMIPVG